MSEPTRGLVSRICVKALYMCVAYERLDQQDQGDPFINLGEQDQEDQVDVLIDLYEYENRISYLEDQVENLNRMILVLAQLHGLQINQIN